MSNVILDVSDNIATVTLARPPVNALSSAMMREITRTFRELDERRDVRVIVLSAEGEKVFCGGADIHDSERRYAADGDTSGAEASDIVDPGRVARDMFTAVYEAASPVIASVHGITVGAGFALVACADFIVAAETASFGLPEITVGVLGGGRFVQRITGVGTMRRLFYTGERVSAEELYRRGGVEVLTPRDELDETTRQIARSIASKSPIGLRLGKQSLNRAESLPVLEGYRLEQDYTARVSGYADSREARNAWREKREPEWGWK